MPDERKAVTEIEVTYSWSVSIANVVTVEPNEDDNLVFLDGEDQLCFTLPWNQFDHLYNRVKEQREKFAKLKEGK